MDEQSPKNNEAESQSALIALLGSAGRMTPLELQKIALRLGNGYWCKHWFHWGDTEKPWVMAVQIRSYSGSPIGCSDLKKHGFVQGDSCLYFINRADENGKLYHPLNG